MKIKFLALVLFLFISCSINNSENNYEIIEKSMVKINADGQVINNFGGNDSLSISFDYDYYILNHEVTQAEFAELMDKEITKDHYPVTDITWYDAVLYCNELSKENNYDTVYSYLSYSKSKDFSVNKVEDLKIDFSKNGYRLPTEAEWIYAATLGLSQEYPWGDSEDDAFKYSWFIGNSSLKLHNIKSLKSHNELYDMGGNAFEFTNDLYGKLPSGDVTNFVGSKISNTANQVVVKGGSFLGGLKYMNIDNRKDEYDATKTSKTAYFGFRVVRGKINTIEYNNENYTIEEFDKISSDATVLEFLNINRAKLVFVNPISGSLNYMDYNNDFGLIEINFDVKVNHPVISPDGNYVAFSTASEGQILDSKIYFKSLSNFDNKVIEVSEGAIPRWWIDPVAKDTFIVYNSSAMNNDNSFWQEEKTYKRLFKDGSFGEEIVLVDNGAFNGGISLTGEYLASGSTQLKIYSSTGIEDRFLSPKNGKSDSASTQVCNVSMSNDSIPQISFVDFGSSKEVSTITNDAYGVHEYLFISDLNDNIKSAIKAPENYKWKHPEWAYNSNFIVSNLEHSIEGEKSILIVQSTTEKNSYLELFKGTQFKQPYLWTDDTDYSIGTNLDLDSAFLYALPEESSNTDRLDHKIRLFWNFKDSIETVVMGHSRGYFGIIPDDLDKPAYNMSMGFFDMTTMINLFENYIVKSAKNVKTVIVSMDPDFFAIDGYNRFWKSTYSKSIGLLYDQSNNFWEEGLDDAKLEYLNSMPKNLEFNRHLYTKGWNETYEELSSLSNPYVETDGNYLESYLEIFELFKENFMKVAIENNIKVIGVIYPQAPSYRKKGVCGVYGPTIEVYDAFVNEVSAYSNSNPNFEFIDMNQCGQHSYTDPSYYFDFNHLNIVGAKLLTQDLNEKLKNIW